MKREFRIFHGAELRARKKDGKAEGIEGHAAVFNQLSVDLGYFRERVMPGAFTDDLKSGPDVRALFNHDPNIVLGRTKAKTLRLSEDSQGLHFDCDLPDTNAARDVMTSIDRGDIDQCSFGFTVTKQKWSEEPDPDDPTGKNSIIVRELHAVKLFDVSPVTYPAYPQTDCDTRSLFPDGVPDEVRSHVPKLRAKEVCSCRCANCQDDNCADCSSEDCTGEKMNCMHSADRSAKVVDGAEFDRMRMRSRIAASQI